MSPRTIRNTLLLLTGLLLVAAFSSASAYGAGKPIVNTPNGGYNTASPLNRIYLQGEVNPNGAATTYKFEYGPTEALGSKTTESAVGSGTSFVSVKNPLAELYPNTRYYFRIVATNQYGTTTSANGNWGTGYWSLGHAPVVKWPSSYSSQGSYEIDFPNFNATIGCHESGGGTIGNKGGSGDKVFIELTECVMVYGAPEYECVLPQPIKMNLDGRFVGTETKLTTITFPEECAFMGTKVELNKGEGFFVTTPVWGFKGAAVNLPLTLTLNASFGLQPVNIAGSSTWSLGGENWGRDFGIALGG